MVSMYLQSSVKYIKVWAHVLTCKREKNKQNLRSYMHSVISRKFF